MLPQSRDRNWFSGVGFNDMKQFPKFSKYVPTQQMIYCIYYKFRLLELVFSDFFSFPPGACPQYSQLPLGNHLALAFIAQHFHDFLLLWLLLFPLCRLIFLHLDTKCSSSLRVHIGPTFLILHPLSLGNLIYTASVSTYVQESHEIMSLRPF